MPRQSSDSATSVIGPPDLVPDLGDDRRQRVEESARPRRRSWSGSVRSGHCRGSALPSRPARATGAPRTRCRPSRWPRRTRPGPAPGSASRRRRRAPRRSAGGARRCTGSPAMSTSGTRLGDPGAQPVHQRALPLADGAARPLPPVQRDRGGVDRRHIGHAGPAAVLVVVGRIRRPPAGRPCGSPAGRPRPARRRRPPSRSGPTSPTRRPGRPGPVPRSRPAPPARPPAGRPRPPPRTAAGCRPRGCATCRRGQRRRPARRPPLAHSSRSRRPWRSTPTATWSPCVGRGRQHRGMIDRGGDDPRADPAPAEGQTGDRRLRRPGRRTR